MKTDCILDIITAIYAIVTIGIFIMNMKAVKATRQELEETQIQFEERKRLEYMPFLLLEKDQKESPQSEIELDCTEDTTYFLYQTVALKNVGNATATTILYDWSFQGASISDAFPVNAIMKGDTYFFQLTIGTNNSYGVGEENHHGVFSFQYNDLLGHTYSQKMFIDFNEEQIEAIDNDVPKYHGLITYSIKKE